MAKTIGFQGGQSANLTYDDLVATAMDSSPRAVEVWIEQCKSMIDLCAELATIAREAGKSTIAQHWTDVGKAHRHLEMHLLALRTAIVQDV